MLVNTPEPGSGLSAVTVAVEKGLVNVLGFLLRHGADPNARSAAGEAPLHFVVRASGSSA